MFGSKHFTFVLQVCLLVWFLPFNLVTAHGDHQGEDGIDQQPISADSDLMRRPRTSTSGAALKGGDDGDIEAALELQLRDSIQQDLSSPFYLYQTPAGMAMLRGDQLGLLSPGASYPQYMHLPQPPHQQMYYPEVYPYPLHGAPVHPQADQPVRGLSPVNRPPASGLQQGGVHSVWVWPAPLRPTAIYPYPLSAGDLRAAVHTQLYDITVGSAHAPGLVAPK